MSNMKCPLCQQELFYTYQQDGIIPNPNKGKVDTIFCDNCKMYGNETIWQELIRTRKELEQSETCCSAWEKQALDYKAENIALSGDLEHTRKAFEIAVDAIDVISLKYHKDTPSIFLIKYAQNAKAEITALEQGGNNDSNS